MFLIEVDVAKRLRKAWLAIWSRFYPKPLTDLKLDEDVINETERVAETPAEQLKIKVQNLRKVYSV